MIKYLIEKEFRQIIRNSFLPKLIIMFPCMVILILPWAASMEIKNLNLCIIDNNQTSTSKRLIQKTISSGYFKLSGIASSYKAGMKEIEWGKADIILEIPSDFEQKIQKEGISEVLISANTVNGTNGSIGSSYISEIIQNFRNELIEEKFPSKSPTGIQIITQNRFNPHLNYKVFMIPALMVMLLTMLSGFLPALNIVEEKEKGTIEQINVTPVSKFNFILAKMIPYWIIGFLVLSICFLLAWLIYGLVPVGNLLTLYTFAIIYVLAVSGMGLVISNYSDTMQQAMFVMYFFIMILLLLSGLFTPINGMPEWAKIITIFNPLRYFIEVMRMVFLKGSNFIELKAQAFVLMGFAAFFYTWAIFSYKKKS